MTTLSDVKTGRPREYTLVPAEGFYTAEAAHFMAVLDELHARVIDQFVDLPMDALTFTPEGTTLSITALVIHLIWAEAGWISRLTGNKLPEDLDAQLTPVGRAIPSGEQPPAATLDASALRALCQRVRDEITRPALMVVEDIEAVIPDPNRPMTPRGVLMHLVWHWTYHSGQVGLLRELWGSGYQWTFGSLGG